MAKLLYITANVNEIKDSFSLSVGQEFVTEYKQTHPHDEIICLDVYKDKVPLLDHLLIGYMHGALARDALDGTHQDDLIALENNLKQFMEADLYVFAVPLWNLGVPPMLKTYFDNIVVVGKTFKYTEKGPVGLLANKKAMVIQAAGGIYSSGPMEAMEHSSNYIKSIMSFLGVSDTNIIWVEGTSLQELDAKKIKNDAIALAKEKAAKF